jgi:hypothetical protein
MAEDHDRLQKSKELIRFFLIQANNNLAQAKTQCLFIYPAWQTIESKIMETLSSIEEILETSKTAD